MEACAAGLGADQSVGRRRDHPRVRDGVAWGCRWSSCQEGRHGRKRNSSFLLITIVVLLLASPASAGVWDPDDTRGPLDVRWIDLKPVARNHVKLTISSGRGSARVPLPAISDRGPDEIPPAQAQLHRDRLHLPRDGHLISPGRLRILGFLLPIPTGSDRSSTLTTTFLPWWIRTGEQENRGVRVLGSDTIVSGPLSRRPRPRGRGCLTTRGRSRSDATAIDSTGHPISPGANPQRVDLGSWRVADVARHQREVPCPRDRCDAGSGSADRLPPDSSEARSDP